MGKNNYNKQNKIIYFYTQMNKNIILGLVKIKTINLEITKNKSV